MAGCARCWAAAPTPAGLPSGPPQCLCPRWVCNGTTGRMVRVRVGSRSWMYGFWLPSGPPQCLCPRWVLQRHCTECGKSEGRQPLMDVRFLAAIWPASVPVPQVGSIMAPQEGCESEGRQPLMNAWLPPGLPVSPSRPLLEGITEAPCACLVAVASYQMQGAWPLTCVGNEVEDIWAPLACRMDRVSVATRSPPAIPHIP